MKKLKKMNLAELAQRMPAISELEQRGFAGGTHYYDPSGNYLGQYGPSDDIRIENAQAYEYATTHGMQDQLTGIGLADAGAGVQYSVLTKNFLSNYGISGVQMTPTDNYGEAGFYNGDFFVHTGSPIFNSMSSLKSTLEHEQFHLSNGHTDASFTAAERAQGEISAYTQQIASVTYSSTNNEYRLMAAAGLYQSWQAAGGDYANKTEDDAKHECGVAGY